MRMMPTESRGQMPVATADHAERGQILVLFALFVVVLIGFAAVAVDLGSYLKVRRDYQNAADAAALAGAPFVADPSPDRTAARQAAWNSLESQLGITVPGSPWTVDTPASLGVADTTGVFRMWVSTPPIGLLGTTAAKYPGARTGGGDKSIFVWVEAQNPSYLSRIFGINGSLVSAWATAGLFPNRFAVITLRQPNQSGPAQPDINLAGTNVSLTVIGGDVGGNYNMKLNSSTTLILPSKLPVTDPVDSQVYLYDYVSCGQSCWGNTQIVDPGPPQTLKVAQQLPGFIPDPNYPLPTSVQNAPTGPTSALPYGYANPFPSADKKSAPGKVVVSSGGDNPGATSVTVDGNGKASCDGTHAIRIGPGFYTQLSVSGPYCVILDPTFTHDCISNGNGCTDTPTAVPEGQMPGVFYFGGTTSGSGINVGNGGMVVGDGVTVVLRPTSSPDKNLISIAGGSGSPAIVDLNNGKSPLSGGVAQTSAAWTRRGVQPYTWNGSGWVYTNVYEKDATQTGVAVYVMRRDQVPGVTVASDYNTNIVQVNASAALSWSGITYAPHDNVTLAGQPGHDGIGQLVAWTFTFNGTTNVVQTYTGPYDAIPLLIEPKLGQP